MSDQLNKQMEQAKAVKVAMQRMKIAGEVRFIKDRSNDAAGWGQGVPGPSNREIEDDATFDAKQLKPLAKTLRATLMAMGHALSAADTFAKIKSANISPDGNLGGKGYIQKIIDMRKQYSNIVEALSALSDTLHDELKAPHWLADVAAVSPRERDEIKEILDQSDDVADSPESWAQAEEQAGHVSAKPANGKTAARIAQRWLATGAEN